MEAEILADTSSGSPVLVYLPGVDGTGELLLDTADLLARRFRLIRLRYVPATTGKAKASRGYEVLAASIARRLQELEVDRALLLGDSFGVSAALRTALDHPDRVAGLALVNGFPYYRKRMRIASGALFSGLVHPRLFNYGRALFAPRMLFAPRRDDAALRAFRLKATKGFDAAYRQRLRMIRQVDLRPDLGRIRQPVAIYASDHDRIVTSVVSGELMAKGLPDATFEILPDAGHMVLPLQEEPWVERMVALAERAGLSA